MFDLYTTPVSANGRKVLAQALHLDLEPRIHVVDVYRGEGQAPDYLAINPTGKVPFLVEDQFRLSESNAILAYVSEVHGGSRLLSTGARSRATILSWLLWEAAHWQPALIEALTPIVGYALFPERVPAPERPVEWHSDSLRPLFSSLESQLERQSYVALPELTVADFSVAGMVTYFHAAAFPFHSYPAFSDWYRQMEALPAWQQTEVDPWTRQGTMVRNR